MMNSVTHEKDFYAWTQEQAHLLKTGQLQQIDWQNIAEEIEDMGRSERRQLESRLEVLMNSCQSEDIVIPINFCSGSILLPISDQDGRTTEGVGFLLELL
jgi:hypothetical protein